MLKALKHSSGNYSLILQGLTRIKLDDVTQTGPYLKAKVKRLEEAGLDDDHRGQIRARGPGEDVALRARPGQRRGQLAHVHVHAATVAGARLCEW